MTLNAVGQTASLTATVYDQNNAVLAAPVTWSSSLPAVATVSNQGLVTAVSSGSTQITARSGSASSSVPVTVSLSAVRIEITPSSATLTSIGQTVQLSASVLDQNGRPVSGAEVTWQSGDEAVATVSNQGLVTAVSNGTTQITARSGSASSSVPVTVMEPSRDRDVLVALYYSTDGANWTNNENWLSDRPIGEWHGVRANEFGRVVELHLNNNGLSGTIPPELGQLKHLRSLFFDRTTLSGSIPPELGRLENLERLFIRSGQLTGPIPPELGQLKKLWGLSFEANYLSGPIPSELGQLENLFRLNLRYNDLTGPIPSEFGQLRNLGYMFLNDNVLSGSIPAELGRLTKLVNLHLGKNQLSGSIPASLGELRKLSYLHLADNASLSGPLPEAIIKLSNLEFLYLADTQICIPPTAQFQAWLEGIANKDTEPAFCGNLERDALIALYERTNGPNWTNRTNWSSVAPLDEWHGVTVDAEGKVTELVLVDNNLSGSLPGQLGNLNRLEILNLSFNAGLSGNLPHTFTKLGLEELTLEGTQLCAPAVIEFQAWLAGIPSVAISDCGDTRRDFYTLAALYNGTDGPNWTNNTNWLSDAPLNTWYGVRTDAQGDITGLYLPENSLRGTIPPELGQLENLRSLNLASNALSGSIPPELGQLENLSGLYLGSNSLSGSIPRELGLLRNLRELVLWDNSLSGSIPSELGQLENLALLYLVGNRLSGSIPSELGQLENLGRLNLASNSLSGSIPFELGQLDHLTELYLGSNSLSGSIPSELGELRTLRTLDISRNRLTGSIPADLGRLHNLEVLVLLSNGLSGTIPPELGQLESLVDLVLNWNELSGSIPPELGGLGKLEKLYLWNNGLSGSIPPELGRLENLIDLSLSDNQLSGSIPPELGRLRNLEVLFARNNELSGPIPPELGQLSKLKFLVLSSNRLTGNIPAELGDLTDLETLALKENPEMAGTLPLELVNLNLNTLVLSGTQLCAPPDPEFQAWLNSMLASRVPNCVSAVAGSAAYLTQATQSLAYPVPLVAGEPALLRVFVTAEPDMEAAMPPVRATFYQADAEVYAIDIPGSGASVPREIDEGDLAASANAEIPGSVIMPGLEMVVEIDPDGSSNPGTMVGGRVPPMGSKAVDARRVPPFDLTLVPFLWEENPDRSVLAEVEGLSEDDDLFRFTRDLLPVEEFSLNVREPVWTSVDPVFGDNGSTGFVILFLTEMTRAMDGASGHYLGILRDGGGVANTPGFVSVAGLQEYTIAHELGHNMSLYHAPCGTPGDPDYPYADGSIGAWGYDLLTGSLVDPETPALMSYCGPPNWISDFHFTKAINYRRSQEQATTVAAALAPSAGSLLLWGGVDGDGALFLEPAFALDASPALPRMDGPYRLVGEDGGGRRLFSLSFGMAEVADMEGEAGSFAFILPVRPDWPVRLHRITLTGPEGVVTLDGQDDEDTPSVALLLDSVTGRVRGVLRDWPEPGVSAASARRTLPESGLDVVISRGIPAFGDWSR